MRFLLLILISPILLSDEIVHEFKSPSFNGSGTSSRHIQSVSEILLQKLKKNGYSECKIEGYESDDWKLIDATDVIVHLFHPEKRSIYNLEKMWEDILPKEQIRV